MLRFAGHAILTVLTGGLWLVLLLVVRLLGRKKKPQEVIVINK